MPLKIKKPKIKKSTLPDKKVSIIEFIAMGFIALIADLIGPFGLPFALVILLWYLIKFKKFPTKKFLGAGASEVISLGILPGWLGFMVASFIEHRKNILFSLLIGLVLFIPLQSYAFSEVTLTWTTDTYVPLEYQGKAMPSRGSNIEVTAILDSSQSNPENLTYNWFINEQIKKENSGQGKQTFNFNIGESITKEYRVKVEVTNNGELIASSIQLPLRAQEPEIVIETNQGYLIPGNQEVKFTARPYFFNINDLNDLDYQWSLNNILASQGSNSASNILNIKIGEIDQVIKQTLSVLVKNTKYLIQRTQAKIEIFFTP